LNATTCASIAGRFTATAAMWPSVTTILLIPIVSAATAIPERLAQPRDVHLHRPRRAGRRVLTPQRHRQALRAHRLVRVQQQHGQHRARLETFQPHRTALAAYFKRPEYLKVHQSRSTTLPRPGQG
jgi:hypothetical protein